MEPFVPTVDAIEGLMAAAMREVEEAKTTLELDIVRVRWLGKKGIIKQLFDVADSEARSVGG